MFQYFSFIARNALRNRRRSLLTMASLAVSLCLLGVLFSMYLQLFSPDDTSPAQALRLVTHHRVSLAQAMPGAYKQRIRQVPGVVGISTWQWFGGVYKDSRETKNFFARLGVDPEDFFKVRPDMVMPPDQKREFIRTQTAAIASKQLADKLDWKLNERITLKGDIFPVTLEFTLVGLYDDPERTEEALYYNDRYLQESLSKTSGQRDTAGAFLILINSADQVPRVAKAIDTIFNNSPAPTKSESEKDFALSFLAFLGNLKLFLSAICSAVMFTILLVSANTVAMTVRERVRETAILRTLGFTPTEIRSLILGEALILSGLGGVLGAMLAEGLCLLFHDGDTIRLPLLTLDLSLILVVVAMAIGILSAIIPAWLASKRPVVESLRYSG